MKRMYFLVLTCMISVLIFSCGNQNGNTANSTEKPKSMVADAESYDPKRGEGKFSAENVKIDPKLDATMAATGEKIVNTKCASCHKMSTEKMVGPGWGGVTTRRKAEWIMNFITNPDPMINKDPEAKAMLELCLVRMPNQSLTDEDARNILEFMRKNDGIK